MTKKFEPGVDLDTFSKLIDDHTGTPQGFAEAVRRLADLKLTVREASERRAAAYTELKTRHGGGGPRVVALGGGKRKVVRLADTKGSMTRTVPADVIKKADKAAYEAAKRPRTKLLLSWPGSYQRSGGKLKLPPLPRPDMDMAQLVMLYQSPLFDLISQCAAEAKDVGGSLEKIAANTGWDGGIEEGDLLTTDGWQLKLRELRYDSEKLKANDPALYERLVRVVVGKGSTRLDISDYDRAVDLGYIDDDAEFGEIDGD